MLTRRRQQKGAVLYETLLSLPILLLLIFLGIKGMLLGYRALVLQYAAGQAVRKLALGVCDGPKANGVGLPDLSVPNDITNVPTCRGAGSAEVKRATYAYDYARYVAYRFGLTLQTSGSGSNYLSACILPLGDTNLISNCKGSDHRLTGVGLPAGVTATFGVLQLRTQSGIRVPSLRSSSDGPITGFDGSSTSEIRAIAIARIERLNS